MSSTIMLISLLLTRYSNAATCADYGNYTSENGEDFALNVNNEIIFANLGLNYSKSILDPAEWLGSNRTCNTLDGCEYICMETASCALAIIKCESPTGCNIQCIGTWACGDLTIYSDTYSSTDLTVTCHYGACPNLQLNIIGSNSAHLHCIGAGSCDAVIVRIQEMLSPFVHSSISCYVAGSCDDMQIYATGQNTQLIMYQYSSNIQFHNNFGYDSVRPTVECNIEDKYIEYEFNNTNNTNNTYLYDLILNEYPTSYLPCEGITIFCYDNNALETINGSCLMEYIFHYNNIDKFRTDPIFIDETCAYISLQDLIQLQCIDIIGQCQSLPTKSPTNTPTNEPTYSPSISPTTAPTYLPSQVPTYSPSISPSIAPSISPTYSPSISPTSSPTTSPTNIPTFSPTQSPTRFPTLHADFHKFDTKIDIVYVFSNLTQQNYNFIINYTHTNVIQYMEAIIESSYLHPTVLSEYKLFDIDIEKINKIEIEDNAPNIIFVEHTGIIYAKSVILFKYHYEKYFLRVSKDPDWQNYTQYLFQRYFNNSKLNFIVANKTTLISKPTHVAKRKGSSIIFWIVTGIVLSCVLGAICASRCDKICQRELFLPTDTVNWFSLILLTLSISDVVTNINAIRNISPTAVLIVYALFIFLRLVLNFYYALKMEQLISYNIYAKDWYKRHKNIFICCVVLSGGNMYPMLSVISSNLCGIKFTNSGISSLEINQLFFKNNKVLLTALCVECLPFLIFQTIYLSVEVTQGIILAFVTTVIMLIIYMVLFIINCVIKMDKMNIFYYIEIRFKQPFRNKKISRNEKKYIKTRKGLKVELTKAFVKLYPNINAKTFEIGAVTIRKKGFFTRFVHSLGEIDLKNDIPGVDENIFYGNLEVELKKYCMDLFNSNKQQIAEIMFNHYSELDVNQFEIRYYGEYPDDEREFIADEFEGEDQFVDIYQNEGGEGEYDGDVAAAAVDGVDEDDDEKEINDYRQQFRKANNIISRQQRKNKHKTDFNSMVFILKQNNINDIVIDDVLRYAKLTFFKKEESNIDQSVEMMAVNVDKNNNDEDDSSSSTQLNVVGADD